MKLKLFFLTALAILLLPVSVLAATFSVRLGQPKTPTNQNSFKLTFVALDTQETGRNITVKCFKKGPSDGAFSRFDSDKVLSEGGNTDYCDVNSSILNADGTYSFYVVASISVPSYEELTSSTVNVEYRTGGPDTPGSYSKERINSCDYKIKFKTANDSRTVKVQLFRSDNLSISVDNSSVISSQNIGPNTDGEFINSVPDCTKDYYYVLRAVDNSDNVSGTVGDSFTTTTTTTTTGTTVQGAIPVISGSQVAGGASTEGNESSISGTPSTAPTGEQGAPGVLGTEVSKGNNLKWLSIPLVLIAAYFFFRSRKRA